MQLQWPGFNAKGDVLIDLKPDSFCLAEMPVLVQGERFTPKQELHVTVIGEKVGLMLQRQIKRDPETNKVLESIFESIDWSFEKTGPVHVLSRLNRGVLQKSIIMLINMPGVAAFYQQLKSLSLVSDNTPLPPAHITLYTYNCPLGIGVPNDGVLDSLSIGTMSLSELDDLCEQDS
jgi:hypothetical protein